MMFREWLARWRVKKGMRWQFNNGSHAPITDVAQLPAHYFVAWDRSLGCEVAYAVESRRGRRAA